MDRLDKKWRVYLSSSSGNYYHRTGCGSLSLKKMWSLEYFKIWQGDLRKSIYICHKSAFNLFEDIVLKIELPERSCVKDVAHMPAQYRHTSVTFCHICHSLVSQSERGRVPSAQANVTLHGLSCTHIVSAPAWHKISILGVFFYVVIIPYFLRLSWVLEGCKTRVLGVYGHLAALSMSLLSKKIRASCLLSLCN